MRRRRRNGIICIIATFVILAVSAVYIMIKIRDEKKSMTQQNSIIKELEDGKVRLEIPRRTTKITFHEIDTLYWLAATEEELETFKDKLSSVTGTIQNGSSEGTPIYYVKCTQGSKTLAEFYFYPSGAVYEKINGKVKIVAIDGENPAYDLMLEWYEQEKSKK